IVGNRAIHELVAALVAFGRRLGARVVAEGVETATQLALLRDMGCDAAQGFLFGPPADFAAARDAAGVMATLLATLGKSDS
ncbi:MAG TPA: EAL domain-containing protein, partial [Azonexus sp.]|nr:EAL domain-containing protein [Azonexus sp.]